MKRNRKARRDDPLEQDREWADHSLNPGHWLGGNVPPGVSKLWSVKDRRWLGLALTGTGVAGFGIALSMARDSDSLLLVSLMLLPYLTIGVILLFSRDRRTDQQ